MNITVNGMTFTIRRGFVESITCSWSDFRTHAVAIRERTPLRKVRLLTEPEVVTAILPGTNYIGLRFADQEKVYDRRGQPDYLVPVMLADRFPGLEFELPQTNVQDRWLMSQVSDPNSFEPSEAMEHLMRHGTGMTNPNPRGYP